MRYRHVRVEVNRTRRSALRFGEFDRSAVKMHRRPSSCDSLSYLELRCQLFNPIAVDREDRNHDSSARPHSALPPNAGLVRPCSFGLRRQSPIPKLPQELAVSCGSHNQPLSVLWTIRGTPPTLVATTGRPEAIASSKLKGRPSPMEGNTKTSKPAKNPATSWLKPQNSTKLPKPR